MLTIKGDKVVVFGDRHIEDVYRGKHKNYRKNSIDCMNLTLDVVSEEKPDLYIETGDFIGVRKDISWVSQDRGLLKETAQFLKDLNCPVVINTGNHDIHVGDEKNDYKFLSDLGYFSRPQQFEEGGASVVKLETSKDDMPIYLHFVKYGCDDVVLKGFKDGFNVAITHGDFRVGNKTFSGNPDAIDLITHEPFFEMDYIINGHIHDPMETVEEFTFYNGKVCNFINIGCMARPKISENYEQVWYIVLGVREVVDGIYKYYIEPKILDLPKVEDIFRMTKSLKELVDEETEESLEDLSGIFSALQEISFGTISIEDRVNLLPTTQKMKDLILEYLR